MKLLSRYLPALSVSLVLMLPKKVAQGCGFYVYPGEYRFWMLQPDLTNQKELSPFYFACSYLYPDTYQQASYLYQDLNINEWVMLTNKKATAADIDSIVYNTPLAEFQATLERTIHTNSFTAFLKAPGNGQYLRYMQLSKGLESIATNPDPWGEDEFPNYYLDSLAVVANKLYLEATNKDVQLRTAYQLMRVHGFNRQAAEMRKVWKSKVEPVDTRSWIKAAAMFQLARVTSTAEADYLYARVFDLGTFNRAQCIIDFKADHLEKALSYTTSEHERTVCYAMQAFGHRGRILPNLQFIYKREPAYKDLNFLLLREINKVEDWLQTGQYTNFRPAAYEDIYSYGIKEAMGNYVRDKRYARELLTFIETLIRERKTYQPGLLYLYAAHLSFILHEYPAAMSWLAQANALANLPANVKTQLLINDLLLQVATEKGISASTENKLMNLLEMPDNKLAVHDPGIMKDQLILAVGQQLIKKGERVKGILLLGHTRRAIGELTISAYKTVYELMWQVATPADYDAMLAIIHKKVPTRFERFIGKTNVSFAWHYWYIGEEALIDREQWNLSKILDLKAGYYIRQDSLDKAVEVLKRIPDSFYKKESYSDYLEGDPFYVNIYHAENAELGEPHYNKLQIVEQVIALKQKAAMGGKDAARNYFKLGNAYYNMSYHGKLWLMVKPWWSTDDPDDVQDRTVLDDFNQQYYGSLRAKQYYLKAMELTKDKKLASLACLMAGKCLQNFREYSAHLNGVKLSAPAKNPYLAMLKEKNMDSRFYQEIIDECDTYKMYNTRFSGR